ncbi:hypothetical protein CWS02_23835 [Enterobacter sp. EA-1]|nr:hypothetical protein CWS02_23835 [Enterobacter sp. EA-1]
MGLIYAKSITATGIHIMLKTLSIRTGLLSLLAVMTLLLLLVSGIGVYALNKSSSSLERISQLQGEKMARLSEGYTQILRARNEAGQAVRMMEVGLLDDAAKSVKMINAEITQAKHPSPALSKLASRMKRRSAAGAGSEKLRRLRQPGITPMQDALNKQSADTYYELLENKLIPISRQFDTDMQAFQSWGEARGKAEVTAVQSSKNVVMMLIVVVALLVAGIIVLAAGAAPYAAQTTGNLDTAGMWRRGI